MPNDATHRIINYFLLSIIITLNFYFGIESDIRPIIIFISSYALGTEVFSPDLDTNSRPSKRLGILSYPIRRLSTHRGIGHNILIGWFLKILYIFLIILIIFIISEKLGYSLYWILAYINNKDIEAFLVGLFLSNAIHIVIDYIWR